MSTTTTVSGAATNRSQMRTNGTSELDEEGFYASLPARHVEPLWLQMSQLVPPSPNPAATPSLWPYSEIYSALKRAGDIVSAEHAERRVLMLVNPSLKAPCTTDSIYAGLQLVLPHETAPAHRHVAFALRFIIEGSRGFTAVSGEKIMMERGDIILTPSWQWHDHGNEGSDPVIWLDGLDLPVFSLLRLNFARNYAEDRYTSTTRISEDSDVVFKWAPVEKALRSGKESHARYDYKTKAGKHLSATLSAQAERISAGSSTSESQSTLSYVYHVVEGEGHSTILSPNADKPQTIAWSSKDTFAVPAWSRLTHTCTLSEGNAFLVAINDRPMVEALGLLKDAASFSALVD
ncbi:hypothetical protein H2200_001247 [Cladophialophora chaetospira]|uniref:Cupin type-2 domain-containing protein n=1 Tax=Cladophialophora chaetospira TaxID=386627 RepID=A0AA39CMV7_9EURO|nr:hypothetical protein H2200_001247 [Cladophialophora chaetospira]